MRDAPAEPAGELLGRDRVSRREQRLEHEPPGEREPQGDVAKAQRAARRMRVRAYSYRDTIASVTHSSGGPSSAPTIPTPSSARTSSVTIVSTLTPPEITATTVSVARIAMNRSADARTAARTQYTGYFGGTV
jgi:hypothetical protein